MVGEWHVYIVECADATLYTGIARDLAKRIATHNEGKGARYVRSRLPVRLVWSISCNSRSAAQREEARIKNLQRAEKLSLIAAAAGTRP